MTTRFRLPLGRALFFVLAFTFALVALLPLRIGLDWFGLGNRGFAAREATGSVWIGAVREAQFGKLALGDLGTSLDTLPLFLGRARISVEGLDGRNFKGAFVSTRRGFGVDDVTAQLSLAGALGPLPIATVDADDVSVAFENGQCRHAEGRVRAGLSGNVGGIPLPALAGAARCDAGLLLLPLASSTGGERLQLRIGGNGRYRAELSVRPSLPGMGPALTAAGFSPAGEGFVLRMAGEL
jgi:general secretion pathway protein N